MLRRGVRLVLAAGYAVYQAQLGMGRLKIPAILLGRPARKFPLQSDEHFPVASNVNCRDVDRRSGFSYPARSHCALVLSNKLKPCRVEVHWDLSDRSVPVFRDN